MAVCGSVNSHSSQLKKLPPHEKMDYQLFNIPDLFECGPGSVNTHSDQRDRADTTQENCSICLDEYEEREEVCKLNCGHKYHSQCIDKWLSMGNMVCPYCRAHIE